jgi:hypothetical protein
MPVTEYAEAVVEKVILKSPPAVIYEGKRVSLVWWINFLGLSWVLPLKFHKDFGFNTL